MRLINIIYDFHGVIILTARPMTVQSETIDWLEHHGISWNALVMRSKQDNLGSAEMKLKALNEILAATFEPILVFDDDPKNIVMFQEQNVDAVSVHSGYYD